MEQRSGAAAVRVGVVGAGVAGLACATLLRLAGIDVAVFDKSRGSGGRASTRRAAGGAFDHGAQYFTVRDPVFADAVATWEQAGVVAEWGGALVRLRDGNAVPAAAKRRLVGVPGMSAVGRYLAARGAFSVGFEVARVAGGASGLTLVGRDGTRESWFDAVVLATPPAQAAAMAGGIVPGLADRARAVPFAPCWAVMLAFGERLPVDFDGAFIEAGPLSWAARDSSKPGRDEGETWVLHGAPDWSAAEFDRDPAEVTAELTGALGVAAGGLEVPEPAAALAHRWAYARPEAPLADRCLFDAAAGVGMCGDWCAEARVEGAFLSGVAMAETLLTHLP